MRLQCNWLIHVLCIGLFQPGLKEKKGPECSGYARLESMEHFLSASHSQRCNGKVTLESSWVTQTVWVNLWSPWRGDNAKVPNKTSSWCSGQNLYVKSDTHVPCLLQAAACLAQHPKSTISLVFAATGQGFSWKGQEMTPDQGSLHHWLCNRLAPWRISTCGMCQVNKGCSWNGFLD